VRVSKSGQAFDEGEVDSFSEFIASALTKKPDSTVDKTLIEKYSRESLSQELYDLMTALIDSNSSNE